MSVASQPPCGVMDHHSALIIAELQRDGRRSYADIGKSVGLSEAAVRRRVHRLREAGFARVVAVVNPAWTGLKQRAYLGVTCGADVHAVAGEATAIAEAEQVAVTAGSFDLLIRIAYRDNGHLLDVLGTVRAIPGVDSAEALLCLWTGEAGYRSRNEPNCQVSRASGDGERLANGSPLSSSGVHAERTDGHGPR